jgi:hypothetical protein
MIKFNCSATHYGGTKFKIGVALIPTNENFKISFRGFLTVWTKTMRKNEKKNKTEEDLPLISSVDPSTGPALAEYMEIKLIGEGLEKLKDPTVICNNSVDCILMITPISVSDTHITFRMPPGVPSNSLFFYIEFA